MEKRKRIIYIGIIFLILLWTALSADQDRYRREFNYATLQRFYQDSLTIDEEGGYGGALAATPEISLPPGRYVITITYDTDTDDNTFYITSDNEAFDNMEGNLLAAPSCRELTLQLEENGRDITVCTYYNGTGRLSVKNVVIQSEAPVCTDRFAIGITAFVLLAVWVWLDRKNSPGRNVYLWILALGLLSTLPFFNSYLTEGHDMIFHLARIEEICAGLKDGQFPVYMQPDAVSGYGYGAPLLYPQLFLYMPALFRAAGVSMVTAVGLFMLAVNLMTAGMMYFCGFRIFSSGFAARICSLLYTFAMYRLINQCTRFAVGELLAMTFLPLVVYGLYEILEKDEKKWPWLTAGCGFVLQSHVISTAFVLFIIVIFCLVFIRQLLQKQRFFALVKAGVWTILLNLWFVVPFLQMFREDLRTGSMRLQFENIALSFLQLFQVFPLSRGDTSFVGESLSGKMPLCIGIALLFFSACFLYGLAVGTYGREKKMPALCLGLGILFALMATQWFPWSALFRIPVLADFFSFFQFPWRFLTCATVFLTFCAGAGACWLRDRSDHPKGILLAALLFTLLPAGSYMDDLSRGEIFLMKEEVADCDNIAGGEYLYEGADLNDVTARPSVPLSEHDGFVVEEYEKQGTHMRFVYGLWGTEPADVELAAFYYPGYEILYQDASGQSEGKPVRLTSHPGNHSYLTVSLPPGRGILTVRYKGTLLWRGCFLVSLAAAVVFGAVLRAEQKNRSVFKSLFIFRDRRHMHGSQ